MREQRREQAFAGDHALAGLQQLVHEAAALARVRGIAEHGVELDRRVLVHQRAGFGDDAFAGVELDLDELHVVADDAVVDFVRTALHRHSARRRRRRSAARELGDLRDRQPVGETFAPGVTIGIAARLRDGGRVVERTGLLAVVAEEPLGHARLRRQEEAIRGGGSQRCSSVAAASA